jgi:hypothetical protein
MQKALFLIAWCALTLFAVRPVPGRGIPVGRGLLRAYFTARQAVLLGGIVAAVGAALLVIAAFRGDLDFALGGVALGWLGGLYLFHGLRGGK